MATETGKIWQNIAWISISARQRPILLQSIRSFTRIKHQLCDPPGFFLQAIPLSHRIDFAGKGKDRLFRLGLTSDGLLVTLGKGLGLALLAVLLPKQETRQSKSPRNPFFQV